MAEVVKISPASAIDDSNALQAGDTFVVIRSGKLNNIPHSGFDGNYESRADFEAATIPSHLNYFSIGGLAFERDATGTAVTSANSVNASPLGAPTPNHWGENTTPGTTDMTAALKAMATYLSGTGKTARLLPEAYEFDASSGLFSVNGFTLLGDPNSTIHISNNTGQAGWEIKGDNAKVTGVEFTGYISGQIGSGDNMSVRGNVFDGAELYGSDDRYGLKVADAAQIAGLDIIGNYFNKVSFAYFSANGFGTTGNTLSGLRIRDNTINLNSNSSFSINSDYANLWREVSDQGCAVCGGTKGLLLATLFSWARTEWRA